MTCNGTLIFTKHDFVTFPVKQRASSQCNCELSIRDNQQSNGKTYLLISRKSSYNRGFDDNMIVYHYQTLINYGILTNALKIDIQPSEKAQVKFFDKSRKIEELPFRIVIRKYSELLKYYFTH